MTPTTSRRAVFGAALILPALASAPLRAAAPQAGTQAPGFFRFKVGGYEVTVINDGIARRDNPAEGFVRNATPDQVRAALAEAFLPTTHFDNTYNITFVNTGRELILFDAGTGGLLAPTAGAMWDNMRAAGLDPAAVDKIVFTHFHGDHVSGLTTREGAARFPNAELIVPEGEWSFWTGDRAPAQPRQMVESRFRPYPGARIRQVASNAEVAPGIVGIPSHGHSPGHTSWRVSDGNQQLVILGDVPNHPVFNVRNPGWQVIFDMDPAAAEATRRRLFDMVATDRIPVVGYHFSFPATGYLRRAGDGFDVVPMAWSSRI